MISKRLQKIFETVPVSDVVADIGTDHGFLAIELVKKGKARKVIAGDIHKGPLERAKKHIDEAGLSDRIETRLGDGLSVLTKGEADTLVISGIGGLLLIKILKESEEIARSFSKMILSPQSDLYSVRKYFAENHYKIEDEIMIFDEKYYTVFCITSSENDTSLSEEEMLFGPVFLKKKPPVWKEYWQKEKEKLETVMEKLQNSG